MALKSHYLPLSRYPNEDAARAEVMSRKDLFFITLAYTENPGIWDKTITWFASEEPIGEVEFFLDDTGNSLVYGFTNSVTAMAFKLKFG